MTDIKTSYMQTAEVSLPDRSLRFYSLEMRPVCPVPKKKDEAVKLVKDDGTEIIWSTRDSVGVRLSDGTYKDFEPRFTWEDAMAHSSQGTYFRFNKHGCCEASCWGVNWYWGDPVAAEAEKGVVEFAHQCKWAGELVFYDECRHRCEGWSDDDADAAEEYDRWHQRDHRGLPRWYCCQHCDGDPPSSDEDEEPYNKDDVIYYNKEDK